jgi:hypothetical protein
MERVNACNTEILEVPPVILAALLDAADEILADAILSKWASLSPPSWEQMERTRMAFKLYPWPAPDERS